MGFCLFNNVAVGAAYLRWRYGLTRILVVDWDLHHGNGTQHMFEHDPGVLYVSTHQYPYYPGTGAIEEVGRGDGEGFTVNLPFRRVSVMPSTSRRSPRSSIRSPGSTRRSSC